MGIFDRLFGKKIEIKDFGCAKVYVSMEGKKRGMSAVPLLIYGHEPDSLARLLAECTTMSCVAVYDINFIRDFPNINPSVGLIAQSRIEHNGEAGEAIKLYKQSSKTRLATMYGAWDYNIYRAAQRAIEYGADGIIMPGIMDSDLFRYIFGILTEVSNEAQIPSSIEEHREKLKKYTTDKSPFWSQENLIVSKYF